jgi:hypothetical protein
MVHSIQQRKRLTNIGSVFSTGSPVGTNPRIQVFFLALGIDVPSSNKNERLRKNTEQSSNGRVRKQRRQQSSTTRCHCQGPLVSFYLSMKEKYGLSITPNQTNAKTDYDANNWYTPADTA